MMMKERWWPCGKEYMLPAPGDPISLLKGDTSHTTHQERLYRMHTYLLKLNNKGSMTCMFLTCETEQPQAIISLPLSHCVCILAWAACFSGFLSSLHCHTLVLFGRCLSASLPLYFSS
jgi:hypothetical protein